MDTDIVFLDTSIVENENFLRGHKLQKLGELSKNNKLNVKITDIVYNEIKGRIIKDVAASKSMLKRINRDLDIEARVLKNFPEFSTLFPILTVDKEKLADNLQERFDHFLSESKIEIISSDIASIKEVFDAYHKVSPPFSEGKRHEFPDAFILNTIIKWCEFNKTKAYVISSDSDFKRFIDETGRIIPVYDLAEFLEMVSKDIVSKEKFELVAKKISKTSDDIKMYFRTNIDDISYKVFEEFRWEYEECEYDDVIIKDIALDEFYITELNDEEASAQFDITIYLEMDIYYDNLDQAIYDREDGRYYNIERITETIEVRANFQIEAAYFYEITENMEINDFVLNWLGNAELMEHEFLDKSVY